MWRLFPGALIKKNIQNKRMQTVHRVFFHSSKRPTWKWNFHSSPSIGSTDTLGIDPQSTTWCIIKATLSTFWVAELLSFVACPLLQPWRLPSSKRPEKMCFLLQEVKRQLFGRTCSTSGWSQEVFICCLSLVGGSLGLVHSSFPFQYYVLTECKLQRDTKPKKATRKLDLSPVSTPRHFLCCLYYRSHQQPEFPGKDHHKQHFDMLVFFCLFGYFNTNPVWHKGAKRRMSKQ